MDTILSLLDTGLQACNHKNTMKNLGDRSKYIGMSEIAKAADCMRAAVANKIHTPTILDASREINSSSANIIQSLRFQRGHWFEAGIVEAFKQSGLPLLSQLTIEHRLHIANSTDTIPLKAHLDLVIIVPSNPTMQGELPMRVNIVEIKSCENIPDTAYAAHEIQLFGQIGLLQKHWHQPSFSLGENQQTMSFPELVQAQWGIKLPDVEDISIEGSLLLVSMNDLRLLGPYRPNEIMMNVCFGLARDIWNYAEAVRAGQISLADVPTVKGWHPLCDFCQWNTDCPRFEGMSAPELENVLLELDTLKMQKDASIRRVQEAEENLKNLFQGISRQNDWVNALTQRFRMGLCEGRKTLDKERLRSALTTCMPLDEAESIIQAGQKVGESYERLYVGTINQC